MAGEFILGDSCRLLLRPLASSVVGERLHQRQKLELPAQSPDVCAEPDWFGFRGRFHLGAGRSQRGVGALNAGEAMVAWQMRGTAHGPGIC